MTGTSIYIKSLVIKNLRTFGDNVTIDFFDKNKVFPKWNLILGENGIGKSTVLQCIAWMKPKPPDLESEGKKIKMNDIEPYITNEENETLLNLVRKSPKGDHLSTIVATFVAEKKLAEQDTTDKTAFCRTSIKIGLDTKGKLSEVTTTFRTNSKEIFYPNEVLIYAYSASRVLGKLNLSDKQLDDTIPGFIAEQTILLDAQEILHTANYAKLGSKKTERAKYKRFLTKVQEMLVSLLPDFTSTKDLEIITPKILDKRLESGRILATTRHGKKIPFSNFSLGYKTVMSWAVDLAWRMLTQYTNSPNPLAEPAIVIIDELDLHLHPQWQVGIMKNLSKHFPNVQFIATAHSPLMVQKPTDIQGWRVDQILTSELFDLPSARGPEYNNLMRKRNALAHKLKLTRAEKIRLTHLNEAINKYPSGSTPEDIENNKLITDILAKYKTNKSVH